MKTPKRSTKRTQFAVLGFLASSPKSGYEIKKAISETTSYFWNESFGQIYPILRELEGAGLVERGELATNGKRTSQKYCITLAGLEALRAWLEAPIENFAARNELLLKMFFGRHVSRDTLIEHLREYRYSQEKSLKAYQQYKAMHTAALATSKHQQQRYLIAPLNHGIRTATTLIEWCDETIAMLMAEAGRESEAPLAEH